MKEGGLTYVCCLGTPAWASGGHRLSLPPAPPHGLPLCPVLTPDTERVGISQPETPERRESAIPQQSGIFWVSRALSPGDAGTLPGLSRSQHPNLPRREWPSTPEVQRNQQKYPRIFPFFCFSEREVGESAGWRARPRAEIFIPEIKKNKKIFILPNFGQTSVVSSV